MPASAPPDSDATSPAGPAAEDRPVATAPTAALTDAPRPDGGPPVPNEHGRVGYGRRSRYTPLALALLLVLALLLIGLYDRQRGDGAESDGSLVPPAGGPEVGQAVPDVTLARFDGTPLPLASLRGSVAVLNFWASWCAPCADEAPALRTVAAEAAAGAPLAGTDLPVVFVGVALKSDRESDARAFVAEHGWTYANGRDAGGPPGPFGPIQLAFGVPDGFYPTTLVLGPDGRIAALHYGALTEDGLRDLIGEASAAG